MRSKRVPIIPTEQMMHAAKRVADILDIVSVHEAELIAELMWPLMLEAAVVEVGKPDDTSAEKSEYSG